jgi:hypothetical protein
MRRPLLIFLGAVGCVLLIVCANVANLMLTRGAGRQRELAVRTAIGAGRGRLVRQLLTESLLLAALGGVVGLGIAALGVRLYGQAVPDGLPWYITLRLDGVTLLVTLGLSALTGVLFGLVPAFRSTEVNLTGALREGTSGAGDGRQKHRLRSTLVVVEVMLSVVLMIGAGLLLRSYAALQGTELGYDRQNILTLRMSLPRLKYDTPEKRRGFYTQLFERIGAIPGVEKSARPRGFRSAAGTCRRGLPPRDCSFPRGRTSCRFISGSARITSRRSGFRSSGAAASRRRIATPSRPTGW